MIAYCIPNLEFYLLSVDVDHAGTKLDPDGQVVDWLKSLVRELEKKT